MPVLLPEQHQWVLPAHGLRVEAVDAHSGGQPLRVILAGLPRIPGRTMADRQEWAAANLDHLRRGLVLEPRGHPEMMACVLTPPQHSGSNFGVLFWHRNGFSPVSGHGVIALATVLVECGLVEIKGADLRLRLDTPAGTIEAAVQLRHDRVEWVSFENGLSRVVAVDQKVMVPGIGEVKYDLAYGGALFAFVKASALGVSTSPEDIRPLVSAGQLFRKAMAGGTPPPGSEPPAPPFGVVFLDEPHPRARGHADGRQVCVFAHGGVDRGPGGAGLSARLALMAHRHELSDGQPFVVEGVTGSTFVGRVVRAEPGAGPGAVICAIEGRAWITGRHTYFLAQDDPFREGFLL